MVSNCRLLYITLTFTTMPMIIIIVTMVDNNAYSFNNCNFEIRSGYKNKTCISSNSAKWNTFGKFRFITLRAEKAFYFSSNF